MSGETLPAKFSFAERNAYQWLMDAGCTGWSVDLLTGRVAYLDGDEAKTADSLCQLIAFYVNGVWDGNVEPEGDT